MDNKKVKNYRTDNLYIATYLKAKGAELVYIGLSPEHQNRYYFEFADNDACEKLQYDYLNDVDKVRTLFDIREMLVKQVKDLQAKSY